MGILKAKRLERGDTVGIIAPASPPRDVERVTKAIEYFERMGYRVELGKHVLDNAASPQLGYLAASDKDRVSDLHAMLRNKRVKAIFLIRGGYGTIRMLEAIDYELIRQNPKILVGYSDATALFNAIYKKTGLASCFFGPMPGVDMWNVFEPFAEECFWRSVTSASPFGELPMAKEEGVLLRGKKGQAATGRMLGGNLTVFNSLLGTPYQPRYGQSIAFFEEIDEKPRKIDSYLQQLRLGGLWQKASAVLIGQFSGCEDDPDSPTLELGEIFEHYFGKLQVPVVANLPWGHVQRQWTIPLGARMRVTPLASGRATIEIAESVLE